MSPNWDGEVVGAGFGCFFDLGQKLGGEFVRNALGMQAAVF